MRGHIAVKNGRYYPVISFKDPATGKWKRRWLPGHKTKREAEKARAEAVTQVNNGYFTMPNRKTVAQLCRDYLTGTAPNRVRPITLQSYRQMLEGYVISKIGAKQATALTPDDLNRIMANMVDTGRSPTTARYLYRIVHRVLDDAVKKGKLPRNVADLADPPPARKAETKVWNEQQFDGFLTAAGRGPYYTLLATLACTGVRVSEGLGLQWGDLELHGDPPTLHVRRTAYRLDGGQWRFEQPKTPRSRRDIVLAGALALLLCRWREQQEATAEWAGREFRETDFVFTRPDDTLPDRHHVGKIFHAIVEQAGLPRIRLHDLRHTYATLLRKYGRSIEEISKVLGHASEVVTVTIYSHWKGESQAVAETMDSILEKAEKNRTKEAFVRNSLEEGEGVECRPYRSRTCDTLIKSQVLCQLS